MAAFYSPCFIPPVKNFGLVSASDEPLLLSEVTISCDISHLTSLVETAFVYKNHTKEPAEAKFVFPLNDVAVFNFEATINDRVVVAECRPRKEAQTVYDEAVATGHTAFIAHQDEECPDIFSMNVGQIPVNGIVTIKLKYIGHLEAENISTDTLKGSQAVLTLPSVICPRYSPSEKKIEKEFDQIEGVTFTSFPYTIGFKAELRMPEAITSVTSERDKFNLELDAKDAKHAKVTLCSGFKPDHCLQMCIQMNKPLQSFALIESGNAAKTSVLAQSCLMAQFMPDFSAVIDEQDLKTELIFVVDRSGSMSGSRMAQASKSLLLFLRSIPVGCRFQIIGFGSTYSTLFDEPQDYNDASIAMAEQYQSELCADMGGTEILPPLRAALDSPLTGQGWYKEVILLTDGDVMNADEVVGLIASNVHKARVFAIGIGSDASTYLISAVARAGRGIHTAVRDETQLQAAVIKILSHALQPRATVTELKWNLACTDSSGARKTLSVLAAPTLPPPVFTGSYSTVYALFDADPTAITGEVVLRLRILDQEKTLTIPVGTNTCILPASENAPVHRLAGKCQLNELNDKYKALQMQKESDEEENAEVKSVRSQMEQLSCLLNIISPYTSFVGVDPVKNEVVIGHREAPSFDYCDGAMACPSALSGGPMLGMDYECADSFLECDYADDDDNEGVAYCSMPAPPMASAAAPGLPFGGGFTAPQLCCMTSNEAAIAVPESPEPAGLVALVKMQHFSGYWPLSEELAAFVKTKLSAVQQKKPKTWPSPPSPPQKDLADSVWATVFVLAYLELKMSDVKDEWALVARKAKTWLRKQAEQTGIDSKHIESAIETLLDEAKKLVSTL